MVTMPSQVRSQILEEHQVLRQMSAKCTRLAKKALKDKESLEALKLVFNELCEYLVCHINREEAAIKPILETIDSWGPVRCERIEKDHKAQRKLIKEIRSSFQKKGARTQTRVSLVAGFLSDLKKDMKEEEADFLSPELMRDDPIVIDCFVG